MFRAHPAAVHVLSRARKCKKYTCLRAINKSLTDFAGITKDPEGCAHGQRVAPKGCGARRVAPMLDRQEPINDEPCGKADCGEPREQQAEKRPDWKRSLPTAAKGREQSQCP